MTQSVLFYVQHLLGVGHLKRAATLASAMAQEGFDVTVAFGGVPVEEIPFSGAEVVLLPPAAISGEDFSTLLGADGRKTDATWEQNRRSALLDLFRARRPDILLIEQFPFGRRQFRFELLPLLETARQQLPRPFIACSVRDILVTQRKQGRAEESVETLRRYFDAAFVHGDPAFVPFGATFPLAHMIADLVRHTGYISNTVEGQDQRGQGDVLVSAGGGAVGAPILFASMAARPLTVVSDRVWRFLAGPNLPERDFKQLAARTDARTIVERFRPDFPLRLRSAALSISQAGYNTVMDLLSAGVPAVVVPYKTPTETEQLLRAELLAAKGFLSVVPAADLTPARLAEAVNAALKQRSVPRPMLDLSGARTTASLLRKLSDRNHVSL
jgi:predicted glycosyltransferase